MTVWSVASAAKSRARANAERKRAGNVGPVPPIASALDFSGANASASMWTWTMPGSARSMEKMTEELM
jgi:hypothetical protein